MLPSLSQQCTRYTARKPSRKPRIDVEECRHGDYSVNVDPEGHPAQYDDEDAGNVDLDEKETNVAVQNEVDSKTRESTYVNIQPSKYVSSSKSFLVIR